MTIPPEKFKARMEKARIAKQKAYERHIHRQKDSSQYRLRDFLNEIRMSNRSGSHMDCIRICSANTYAHEKMKFDICWQLAKWNHTFVTEAIFNNNKRADIIDLDTGIIYEVTYSETTEELQEKIKEYPEVFEVRQVSAKQEFKEELLL